MRRFSEIGMYWVVVGILVLVPVIGCNNVLKQRRSVEKGVSILQVAWNITPRFCLAMFFVFLCCPAIAQS